MKFDCKFDAMVNVGEIKPHPKNNNKHPQEQIEAFMKTIKKMDVWRIPLIISKHSGFLVSGHLRLIAAKELGLLQLPVVYQDFESDAKEYQFLTFDNEIARWAELDFESVKFELDNFPDLEWDDLGIKDLSLDDKIEDEEKETSVKTKVCPECGHEF